MGVNAMTEDIFESLHKICEYETLKSRLKGIPCSTCGKLECNGFHTIAVWCDQCDRLHGLKQTCPKLERLT